MKITIESNSETFPDPQVSHVARVDELQRLLDSEPLQIPIYRYEQGSVRLYSLHLCGMSRSTPRLELIPRLLRKAIIRFTNFRRLPSYVFIARHTRELYPVYTIGSEVCAITSSGPIFQHVELAKVREYLSEYRLRAAHGRLDVTDKLHVRGVDPKTLGLIRPLAYLRKRVYAQTDFWAPVFLHHNGDSIYTFAANARRETPVTNGLEIFDLCTTVGKALRDDNRLQETHDLRPDRLLQTYWDMIETQLHKLPDTIVVAGRDLEVYRHPLDETFIVLEPRADEVRYNLFLGNTIAEAHRYTIGDFLQRDAIFPPSEAAS